MSTQGCDSWLKVSGVKLSSEKMNVEIENHKNQKLMNLDNIIKRILYVNQPSSISKRELPFLGPVRTGEGARD